MKKAITTNSFTKGLMMDFHPMMTPNNVLTNVLNATLITYNGNEYALLNDMGNGRVETAELPAGYIPLGIAELGGIIYIVSYNPQEALCLIGSFPSPERNITSDELKKEINPLKLEGFYSLDFDLAKTTIKVLLTDIELNPGDKFKIFSDKLSDLTKDKISGLENNEPYSINKNPKWIKFHVASILDDGKIVYLDDSLVWNDNNLLGYPFYIKDGEANITTIPEEYSNEMKANYCVFNSKTSGKLAIIAELEVIDTFDCSLELKKEGTTLNITPILNWTYENELKSLKGKVNPSEIKYFINDSKSSVGIPIPENRKNDGTDNSVELSNPIKITNLSDDIINLDIIPGMKFGYMPWLKHSFSINPKKLGTGETSLNEYRYFIEDNIITLNWGFDSYPEEGKKVEKISFTFYNLTSNNLNKISSSSTIKNNNKSDNKLYDDNLELTDLKFSFDDVKRSSYLGHFQKILSIGEDQNLDIDKCYIVQIYIKYGDEDRYIYRILYTCKVFNDDYYKVNDFSELFLTDRRLGIGNSGNLNINNSEVTYKLYNNNIKVSDNKLLNYYDNPLDINYKVESEINNEYSINITFDSKYNIFKINPDPTKQPDETKVEFNNTHDAIKYIIGNLKDVENEIIIDPKTALLEINSENISYDNNKFLINNILLKILCNIPFFAKYDSIEDLNVEYVLDRLIFNLRYLATDISTKTISIHYFSKWDKTGKVKEIHEDSCPYIKSLTSFPDLSDLISNDLNATKCDIFVVACNVANSNVNVAMAHAQNNIKKGDNNINTYRYNIHPDWDNENESRPTLFMYIIKMPGSILFFPFIIEMKSKGMAPSDDVEVLNSIIEDFSKYYVKPIKNTLTFYKYRIKDNFYSWNNFNINSTISINISNLSKILLIQDLNCNNSNINNLTYQDKTSDCNLKFNTDTLINMNLYNDLIKFLSLKVYNAYIKDDSYVLIEKEISPRCIYKIQNNDFIASNDTNFDFFGEKHIKFDIVNDQLQVNSELVTAKRSIGWNGENFDAGKDGELIYITLLALLNCNEWNH